MGKAVLKMFSQLGEKASLLYPDLEPGSVKAFVFGGAAVHLYTNARGSHDVDAEIVGAGSLAPEDLVVTYEDEEGEDQILVWDSNYNPTLAPLHEDYMDDAICITDDQSETLWVYLVAAVDLAVSKLGRFAAHDREDIKELARKGLINTELLRERAEEAFVYYVGNVETARGSLNIAVSDLHLIDDEE